MDNANNMTNCLGLKFSSRNCAFAKKILLPKYQENLMTRSRLTKEKDTLWFMGSKSTTMQILEELRAHNIRVNVKRDAYFRRDFVHYEGGEAFCMSKKEFRERNMQTVVLEEKEKVISNR